MSAHANEAAIDRMLEQIALAVERLEDEVLDVEVMPGKLVIESGNGTRIILSRQSATGQIWLAEPGGGWHFDERDGGLWICDKRGVELIAALETLLSEQLGRAVSLAAG